MTSRAIAAAIFIALGALVLPTAARAQSTIAGVVKDMSGAVLPGVLVEASSDVLIEKTRSVTTDAAGQYKIVDLRPGVYVVTFTLTGFQTFRRDGIDLPSSFTATINADLKVGALEETVTVTGDAPIVDVQTTVHTQVLGREVLDALPTGRTIQGLGQLVVGIGLNVPDVGGSRGMPQTYVSTHGMEASNDTRLEGGPVLRDRLWFFGTARQWSVDAPIAGTFVSDGTPSGFAACLKAPASCKQGIDDQKIKSALARLTWQVSPRNKVSAYWDEVDKFRGHAMTAGDDYDTASVVWNSPAYHTASAKWTSTVSNKLLIEGGYSNNTEDYTNEYQPGLAQARGTAAWYAGASRRDLDLISTTSVPLIANVSTQSPLRYNVQGSASYVIGSHNMKVGLQRTWGHFGHPRDVNDAL